VNSPVDVANAHEARIRKCRSCGTRIVFLTNAATGNTVPVDADQVQPVDEQWDRVRHVSHFKTCNDPNRFTRKR
jgi:hypothetical protein